MTITVRGPNNVTVNFPDDTDAATIDRVMRQNFGDAEGPKKDTSGPGALGDISRYTGGVASAFGHGNTLGLSDYLGAGARYVTDKALGALGNKDAANASFNDELKAERGEQSAFKGAHPFVGGAADLAGGLTSPIFTGIGKGVDLGVDAAQNLLDRSVPSIVKYGLQGGAAGGAAGLFGAQGQDGGIPSLNDVLRGTALGTGFGAATGMAAPYIAKGVTYGLNKASDLGNTLLDKLPYRQDSAAGRELAKLTGMDSLTPDAIETNRAAMGPSANFVDAAGTQDPNSGVWLGGKNVYRAADALANQPGATQDLAERVMKPRAAQAGIDLSDSIQNHLAPNGADFYDTLDTLSEKQANEASPYFQNAFKANQSVSDPRLDRILQTPAGQDAMDYARTRMGNKLARMAVPDPELTAQYNDLVAAGKMEPGQSPGGVASGLKLQTHDLIRQNLGEQLAQKRLQVAMGNARPSEASDLADLYGDYRQALIDNDVTAQAGPNSLKADGGDYEKGLKAFAGPAQLKDAMQQGRDFMSGDRELTAKDFAKLTPSEQDAFRLGAARTVQGSIEQTGTVPKSLQNILNPASKQRKLMQTIFPNFDNFLGDVATKARQAQSARMISGSDTGARIANQADLLMKDLGGSAISLATGHPVGAATGFMQGIGKYLSQPSQAAQDQLGRYLVDPTAFPDAMNALRSRAQIPRIGARASLFNTPQWALLSSNFADSPAAVGGLAGSLFTTGPSQKQP
jgi:hypothetical protein